MIVKSRDEKDIIFTAHWNGEKVKFSNVVDGVSVSIKKWETYGLHEIIGLPPLFEMAPIITTIDNESFLDRLASFLTRTTGFVVEVNDL